VQPITPVHLFPITPDWTPVAAALTARPSAINCWLATKIHLGNLPYISREFSAGTRQPDLALVARLA
jgi:hypothetical protein